MKGNQGVVYIAYGPRAVRAAKRSIGSLRARNHLPVVVLSDDLNFDLKGVEVVQLFLPGTNLQRSRQAKLQMLKYVPSSWKYVLYLDADTEVQQSLKGGFDLLRTGWDIAITPSTAQGNDLFHHITGCEVANTIEVLGNPFPLQLQAGVLFARPSQPVRSFFEVWYQEWQHFRGQDQAAMLRALDKHPIRICLLSRDFNGGSIVQHYFGRAR